MAKEWKYDAAITVKRKSSSTFPDNFILRTEMPQTNTIQSWKKLILSTLDPTKRVRKEDKVFTSSGYLIELITFEILAAERLRLMGFDNQLIIACFANIVNILILLFSTNESNYLENLFLEMKRVNLLSKTHRNDKSNLKPMTVLQE